MTMNAFEVSRYCVGFETDQLKVKKNEFKEFDLDT